jgi:NAD-dependent DNA ligase
MDFSNIKRKWKKYEKIQVLQRWLIVHSIIYYNFGTSIVTDTNFDKNCRHLLKYKEHYPKSFRKSKYYKVFKDFTGETGFDLFSKLKRINKKEAEYLERIAYNVVYNFKNI